MGERLIKHPDIIKKAKTVPYYVANKSGSPDLVHDLRQDFWEAAWMMSDDTPIALAITKLRCILVDLVKSRVYHYSYRQKRSYKRSREVISVPCFSTDLANNGNIGEPAYLETNLSPGMLAFVREIEQAHFNHLNEEVVNAVQYLDWIKEVRLSSIMHSFFYEGRTQQDVGKDHGLDCSMISKEIKRGLNIIRSHIDGTAKQKMVSV